MLVHTQGYEIDDIGKIEIIFSLLFDDDLQSKWPKNYIIIVNDILEFEHIYCNN